MLGVHIIQNLHARCVMIEKFKISDKQYLNNINYELIDIYLQDYMYHKLVKDYPLIIHVIRACVYIRS